MYALVCTSKNHVGPIFVKVSADKNELTEAMAQSYTEKMEELVSAGFDRDLLEKWSHLDKDDAYIGSGSNEYACYAIVEAENARSYAMDRRASLLGETIQDITLYAWPIVWNDNKYDQDSREVLIELRGWACEFQEWWDGLDDESRDKTSYTEEVSAFARRKAREYVLENVYWKIDDLIVEKYGQDVLDDYKAHIEREYVNA